MKKLLLALLIAVQGSALCAMDATIVNVSTNVAYLQYTDTNMSLVNVQVKESATVILPQILHVAIAPVDCNVASASQISGIVADDGSGRNVIIVVTSQYADSGSTDTNGNHLYVPVALPYFTGVQYGPLIVTAFWQGLRDGGVISAVLLAFVAVRWALGMVNEGDNWE